MRNKPPRPKRPRAAQVVRLDDAAPRPPSADADGADHCSFCGRGPADYRAAVRGPAGIICDDCLTRAKGVVDAKPRGPGSSS